MSARGRVGGGRCGEAAAVFIVAASDVVCAGLASLLEADGRFEVAGGTADLAEFAARGAESRPADVVVYDAEGQDEKSSDALRSFVEDAGEGADAPAFVVIGAEQSAALEWAIRAGVVRAVLPRAASGPEIVAAVEAVSVGLYALDVEAVEALFTSAPAGAEPADARSDEGRLPRGGQDVEALTPREREVLDMLAEGLSNKEIAWRMNISEHTVKFHVASVFDKLGVSTRTEAVTQGIRRGLVML